VRRAVLIGPAPPLRGGISAHTARLAEALEAAGIEPCVLSYSRLYPGAFFPGSAQRDSALGRVGQEMIDVVGPRSWKRAARFLRSAGAEVVAFQWWHPVTAAALAASLAGVPRRRVVALCHNLEPHEHVPLARPLARLALGRAGRVLCHSRSVAVAVEELGIAARVAIAPMPPLAAPLAIDAGRARAWAREKFAIAEDAAVAVFAGHLRGYKGLDVLLHAWRMLAAAGDHPGRRLVIAGESYLLRRELARVSRAAADDSSIILENRYLDDEELQLLVKRATVLVLPYRTASQSGLLPLARALGARVLTSDAGGLPDQASGRELVPAGDPVALAAALAEALEDGCAPAPVMTAATFRSQWHALVEAILDDQRP